MYFKALFRRCRISKMSFPPRISNFLKFVIFPAPMKSQIIEDKHSILCSYEQNHAHFTYNSEPTFQYKKNLTYCHLKIVNFAKSGKFLDLLVILAFHSSPMNLQNTLIFGFAGTTLSLGCFPPSRLIFAINDHAFLITLCRSPEELKMISSLTPMSDR